MFVIGYIIRFITTFFSWYTIYAFMAMLAGKRVRFSELTRQDKRGLILISITHQYHLPEILIYINPSIAFILLSVIFIVFLKERLNKSWTWILGTQSLYMLMGFPAMFLIYVIVSAFKLTDFRWYTILYNPFLLVLVGFLYWFTSTTRGEPLRQVVIFVYSKVYIALAITFIGTTFNFFYWSMTHKSLQSLVDYDLNMFLVMAFLAGLILIMIIYKIYSQNKKIQTQARFMTDYAEAIELLHQEMRAYKHDFDNILLSLKILVDGDDSEALKAYFESNIEVIPELDRKIYDELLSLELIENHSLKSFLFSKTRALRAQYIALDIQIENKGLDFSVEEIDLYRVLDIVFNRAVMLMAKSDERKVELHIFEVENMLNMVVVSQSKSNYWIRKFIWGIVYFIELRFIRKKYDGLKINLNIVGNVCTQSVAFIKFE